MKITVVNGEDPQKKYIFADKEKIALSLDFSSLEEMPHHHLAWETGVKLDKAVILIKKLFDEARHYQCSSEDRSAEGSSYRIVAVGRTLITDQLRLYPQDDFWENENPLSQIHDDDVCIGLLTPHYALHFYNAPIKMEKTTHPEEAALEIGMSKLKYVHDGTLHEGINRAQISAYSNLSGTLAEIIATTSPAFTAQEESAKIMLTPHLDQILTKYPKPVKVN
ncbi:MAG: hypothetical protein Q7S55_04850 [Nanoarchaeota archaeon]|nr:hypothetical protein [Nanoarchaeota archaeon]